MSHDSNAPIQLAENVVGLYRDGEARIVESKPGPPTRIEGYTVGAPLLTHEPPHGGEMHPDGDELLYLISGRLTVELEDQQPPRRVELTPGQAVIVPRGVWHRVFLAEPSRVLYVTPGPGSEHRPLP